jgi:hypothetical protein
LVACGESTREPTGGSAGAGAAPPAGTGGGGGSGRGGASGAGADGGSAGGGAGKGAGSGGGAGTSAGSGGGAGKGNPEGYATVLSCRAEKPCASLSTVLGEVNLKPTAEQLGCVLEALRDGIAAVHEEVSQLASASGSSGGGSRYLVHDDRTFDVVSWYGSNGPGGSFSNQYGPARCELFPAEHYTACLDALEAATTPSPDPGQPATTTYQLSDCGIGTNCVETPGTCP